MGRSGPVGNNRLLFCHGVLVAGISFFMDMETFPCNGSPCGRFLVSAVIIALSSLVAIQQSWVKHRPIEAAHERANEQ